MPSTSTSRATTTVSSPLPFIHYRAYTVVRRESRHFTVRPVKTHKVVEHSHEVCFSKLAIKRCPHNSYAVRREAEPTDVVYTCLDRQSRKAEHMLRSVHNDRVIRELSNMTTAFTKPVYLPIECRNTDI